VDSTIDFQLLQGTEEREFEGVVDGIGSLLSEEAETAAAKRSMCGVFA
jgi:hypothetical protein